MLTRRVMCGSRKMKRHPALETPHKGGKPVTVVVEECLNCGERYYDLAAMQKLERNQKRPAGKQRADYPKKGVTHAEIGAMIEAGGQRPNAPKTWTNSTLSARS
jgi:hypothetical protein